jgi:hypothetical protein
MNFRSMWFFIFHNHTPSNTKTDPFEAMAYLSPVEMRERKVD